MPELNEAPREVAAAVAKHGGKTHPLVIVAAGAVTLFSVIGVGMMTGIIPSAHSDSTGKPSAQVVLPNPGAVGAVGTASTAGSASGTVAEAALPAKPNTPTELKPIESRTIGQPTAQTDSTRVSRPATPAAPPVATAPRVEPRPTVVSGSPGSASERVPSAPVSTTPTTPVVVATANPAPANTPVVQGGGIVLTPDRAGTSGQVAQAGQPAPVVCRTCGTVDSITAVDKPGEASGTGAVIGGVLGGVLGNQAGKGRGRDVATVAGAVGGAILGHQIEKGNKGSKVYDVRVRMDDNTFQTIRVEVAQDFRVGDKVKIEGGKLIRA